jgi:hypothetical protein
VGILVPPMPSLNKIDILIVDMDANDDPDADGGFDPADKHCHGLSSTSRQTMLPVTWLGLS